LLVAGLTLSRLPGLADAAGKFGEKDGRGVSTDLWHLPGEHVRS
jgi:hypothetical protein